MKALPIVLLMLGAGSTSCATAPPATDVALTTVALRVHRMDAMVAFYEEAFGFVFRSVDTSGLDSRFGTLGDLELKLVPLRTSVEFDEFPSHQLGFEVPDVDRVIELALAHGGAREGEVRRAGGRVHAAVRDPDGNTLELTGDGS